MFRRRRIRLYRETNDQNNFYKFFGPIEALRLNDLLDRIENRVNDIRYGEVSTVEDLDALVRSLIDDVAEFLVEWNKSYSGKIYGT